MPVNLKGWPIFRELALKHRDDPRYEFLHLGGATERRLPVAFHEVAADQRRPRLMQETLEALQVDAVLIWPLCRETFSFTAYEATAAGCAIVTWPDSGNVAAFAAEAGRGWVLPDEPALFAAAAEGRLADLSRAKRKPQLFDLAFSRLSFDVAAP
jgi:glycosyltransferase involved in cell wall biosynthesis